MEEHHAPIALSDAHLKAIGYALFPYAQLVHRTIAPLMERNAALRTIEAIRKRISAISTLTEGEQPFWLTDDEFTMIDNALTVFIENIARFIPASQERDEILHACETLQSYLQVIFSPLDASTKDQL